MFSLSTVVLAKEGISGEVNQIELIKQTLSVSGDTMKFVGIIASIILPLIIFLIGYQIVRSYQFEKEYREIRNMMFDEYKKLQKITSDSELFANQTKTKLTNLEDVIATLTTDFLSKTKSSLVDEVKEETGRAIAEIKNDEEKRSAELMKKLENLDLTLTPTVYIERGSIYLDQRNYKKAIENYDKAIEQKENQFDAYFNRGLAYLRMDKYDEAINDFIKSAEIRPKSKETFANLGICYLLKEEYENAIKYLNKAIEIDSKYAFAYEQKARVYKSMKKYDLAINEIKEALKIKPNDTYCINILGILYEKMGDHKLAIEQFLIITEKSKKKDIMSMQNLTEAYICNKNYTEAEKLAYECYSISSNIREKIFSKYLWLLSLILNNKEYKLELKSFVEDFVTAGSNFKILNWSFDEVIDCLKDATLQKPSVQLIKKIIGFLKGEITGEELLPE
jgi:tetratricopeptide (TPR) repeat protein